METRVMDKRMSPGTRVVYKDGEHWQEGVVESCCAEGVAMVRSVKRYTKLSKLEIS